MWAAISSQLPNLYHNYWKPNFDFSVCYHDSSMPQRMGKERIWRMRIVRGKREIFFLFFFFCLLLQTNRFYLLFTGWKVLGEKTETEWFREKWREKLSLKSIIRSLWGNCRHFDATTLPRTCFQVGNRKVQKLFICIPLTRFSPLLLWSQIIFKEIFALKPSMIWQSYLRCKKKKNNRINPRWI